MKHTTRTIHVFENANVHIAVEGDTISIQVADPKNPANVWKGVMPFAVAATLSETLNTALAASGEAVNEVGLEH